MFRKAFIIVLMAPLLFAAVANGASLPLVILMVSLLLIALAESSARGEQQE